MMLSLPEVVGIRVAATISVMTAILVVIPIGAVVAAVVMPLLAMVAVVVTIACESRGGHREQHHKAQAEHNGGALRRLFPVAVICAHVGTS